MMNEQEDIKTAAELEAEARERARAEIDGDKSAAGGVQPGQPQVVQHAKRRSRRTLVLAVISLVLLVIIATGGDYLMGKLKGDGSASRASREPEAQTTSPARERQNIGRDLNPLGQLTDSAGQEKTEPDDTAASPPESPAPVTFDKVSALAESGTVSTTSAPKRTTGSNAPSAGSASAPGSATPAGQAQDNGLARITGVKRLGLDPDLYIPSDRHIPCAMMQRFVSDVGGRFKCLISEDVYSASNAVTLIPAGTEARGLYRTGTLKNGQGRLFLAITELRTPEPGRLVIPMADSQAVGAMGENGVAGWIDNHWLERIGNTLLLGSVQDIAAAASGSSPGRDRNTDYTENTRAATAEMAKTLLENSINIPPTMYLNQGDVIGLVTGADIDFSDVYRLRMR
ncbi:VirB10/TraB/TrbI family type IV secretion system protein (plasmid) [Enterobacter sp. D2]|uniref:VirB10/TraB/TrbI family type IV secretion system protein n=1 Tax=Enterobacter sp. D2 TaxID=3102784 RepID=UPI002ACA917A|nr:VirB10/TraB/TrbI family type IV secretion system protein [Enterobacter sp. D2]MDZ5731006.1 VirB10/TraB/TrbI family type IV secretion system protein [Enterobacter sp. D2]